MRARTGGDGRKNARGLRVASAMQRENPVQTMTTRQGERTALPDLTQGHAMQPPVVPHATEVERGGEPARARADDEDAPAAGRRVDADRPTFCAGAVSEEALDGVDADGRVELGAVAARFAGVVADAAVHSGQWVVTDEVLPGFFVALCLREGEPALDVLARGARVVARRQEIDVDGPAHDRRLHRVPMREVG